MLSIFSLWQRCGETVGEWMRFEDDDIFRNAVGRVTG